MVRLDVVQLSAPSEGFGLQIITLVTGESCRVLNETYYQYLSENVMKVWPSSSKLLGNVRKRENQAFTWSRDS